MKKTLLFITTLLFIFTLAACDDACVGAECIVTGTGSTDTGSTGDYVVPFTHINGEGHEVLRDAYILFEFEARDYVKYQISYLSCTCRSASVNFWQVAYIEINKITNDINFISFGNESGGHYTGGMWGDSSPTPAGKTLADFEADYIPWLIGQDSDSLDGISIFKNDDYFGVQNTKTISEQGLIDSFANSSVSTNNMIRIVKELLKYHEENYK